MDIEAATELAKEYILEKAGYSWAKVVSTKLENNKWIVKVDVGSYTAIIKTVTIDNATGQIVGYE